MEGQNEPTIEKQEDKIAEIAELLKNNRIDQVVTHGKDKKIDGEDGKKKEALALLPDLDARTALYLLEECNKKPLGEIYNEGAMTSLISSNSFKKEQPEKKEGLRVFLDVGGEWLKVEKNNETTTIHIDHHGVGRRDPTTATRMLYEIMDKADLLKEKPEWLKKFVVFVNEVDNLTYLDKTDEKRRKIFDEKHLPINWPYTLYALAESIPFETLVELCKSEKIKDLSKPLTSQQLEGEIGKIKTKDGKSIVEKCKEQKGNINKTITGIKTAIRYAREKKLNLNTESLGELVYHNFPEVKPQKGKEYTNTIPIGLMFIGTKALNKDSCATWNKKEGTFNINAHNPNLSKIVEELNKLDPGCAVDIRGEMVFGKIKNLTEEQFLNTIDPNILKNAETFAQKPKTKKDNKTEEEKQEVGSGPEIKVGPQAGEWTEEDEETLNNLLKIIENAKKRLKEIEKEEQGNMGNATETQNNDTINIQKNFEKKLGTDSLSTDFIGETILSLLQEKKIKVIKNPEVNGVGKEITINTIIKEWGGTIEIQATLENKGNNIVIKNHKIDAVWPYKGKAEKRLLPLIDKIPELLKDYIEKEKDRKVEKILIEDGQLKILYKK